MQSMQYPEWLANVVLVPKPNGKWCLCIDFTDFHKACPKDPFPLQRINVFDDSTSGCEMLSFLDAYKGYNQISVAPKDQENASFVTDQGVFCYNVMPFGLKMQAKELLDKFERSSLIQVSRADNAMADQLAKIASSMAAIRNRRITFLSSDRAAIEQQLEILCMNLPPPSWKDDM
ncbi:UNVERIFIED_CONTAM: Transposon Ty3-G Gag-Pol polyprotein [Sesamum calycinum]|uniref:Transposon Ty3-G Gag-Pol polyprotein n=1 Tax=Sesamum calycinum TaxID=2727403 RepID=A0AAW2SUS7_9LAMI